MNWENYICEGQLSIFDFLSQECVAETVEAEETVESNSIDFEEMLKKALISYGTGFVNGKCRIQKILRSKMTKPEKIAAIKKEFGCGGYSSGGRENGVHGISTIFGNALKVDYCQNSEHFEKDLSWTSVFDYLEKWDNAGEYYNVNFFPEDIVIEKHYICNNSLYLKISPSSGIYSQESMKTKNLFIVFKERNDFKLVSVNNSHQIAFELTDDELEIIRHICCDYGFNTYRGGIWSVLKDRYTGKEKGE